MPRAWKEWTTRQLAFLDTHYPIGMPVAEIAKQVGHTPVTARRRAQLRGLRRPLSCSTQSIANFERAHGRRLVDIASEYRDCRLSRAELASDIGIGNKALRSALGEALWQSWPRMTIGRIDAARNRVKAA